MPSLARTDVPPGVVKPVVTINVPKTGITPIVQVTKRLNSVPRLRVPDKYDKKTSLGEYPLFRYAEFTP